MAGLGSSTVTFLVIDSQNVPMPVVLHASSVTSLMPGEEKVTWGFWAVEVPWARTAAEKKRSPPKGARTWKRSPTEGARAFPPTRREPAFCVCTELRKAKAIPGFHFSASH